MLDELGNLQSEGHGISGFETMLSIGLGQEQQFTLILQTLQQLRDVYGDSVDKIVQGNTSNIVFLKSTDDTMIDTLQKMSGTTHKSFIDSKTVTIDMEKLWLKNEGKVPYTITTREVPVISYNDFAFISERNSIVIRAGDSPIWNRNETILPMSWRLFGNTIKQPGKEYSLQTIPTLSSAIDFDIRRNQPDFNKMFDKRIAQAYEAEESRNLYQKVFGYTEYEMEQLDPDNCADEIMEIINMRVKEEGQENLSSKAVENTEQIEAAKVELAKQQKMDTKIFADKHIAPGDLYSNGRAIHSFDNLFIHAYFECKGDMEQDKLNFNVRNGSLYDSTGSRVYIKKLDETKDFKALHDAGEDPDSNVYDENDAVISNIGSYEVTDAFYEFLARQTSWSFAKGRFDSIVARDFDEA